MKPASSVLSKVVATMVALGLLWLTFGLYASGQVLWAVLILTLGGISLYVYVSANTLAWRYLFPGVLAMLVFVAFPLVYTLQIGFTNYSASNLLSEERARGYLLEQAEVSEARAYGFAYMQKAIRCAWC
jgi:maltose/maltodextrin transport system permease protein